MVLSLTDLPLNIITDIVRLCDEDTYLGEQHPCCIKRLADCNPIPDLSNTCSIMSDIAASVGLPSLDLELPSEQVRKMIHSANQSKRCYKLVTNARELSIYFTSDDERFEGTGETLETVVQLSQLVENMKPEALKVSGFPTRDEESLLLPSVRWSGIWRLHIGVFSPNLANWIPCFQVSAKSVKHIYLDTSNRRTLAGASLDDIPHFDALEMVCFVAAESYQFDVVTQRILQTPSLLRLCGSSLRPADVRLIQGCTGLRHLLCEKWSPILSMATPHLSTLTCTTLVPFSAATNAAEYFPITLQALEIAVAGTQNIPFLQNHLQDADFAASLLCIGFNDTLGTLLQGDDNEDVKSKVKDLVPICAQRNIRLFWSTDTRRTPCAGLSPSFADIW